MSLFPSPPISAFADIIIALLRDHPEQWMSDRYTLNHPSGIRIWICSGFWFVRLYDGDVRFGWKKIPIWLACRRVLKRHERRAALDQLNAIHARLGGLKDNVVAIGRRSA